MSLFPKARPTRRPRSQVRRRIDTHAFVESGQSDHRGMPICDDCGHLLTSAVHAPATDDDVSSRILGEGGGDG